MLKPAAILSEFVLERIEGEPLARRIVLCRALAAVTANKTQRAELVAMADELARIERRHRQLLINFRGGRAS